MCSPEAPRAIAPLLAALLLAACSSAPRQPLPPPLPPPPQVVEVPAPPPPPLDLAEFVQSARSRPPNELLAETQSLLEKGDLLSRLRAAITLAQPQHPARDEARAVAMADEIARGEAGTLQLREAAALVALWLDELRRGETVSRRAQTKARDDELRIQNLEQRLREAERRAQEAEKKLEALRAIERDLSGRGPANGRPERPQ